MVSKEGERSLLYDKLKKNEKLYKKRKQPKDKSLVGNGFCTLELSSVGVTDKFTIQDRGGHLFGSISIEKQTSNSI